jgi:hypothetical protein
MNNDKSSSSSSVKDPVVNHADALPFVLLFLDPHDLYSTIPLVHPTWQLQVLQTYTTLTTNLHSEAAALSLSYWLSKHSNQLQQLSLKPHHAPVSVPIREKLFADLGSTQGHLQTLTITSLPLSLSHVRHLTSLIALTELRLQSCGLTCACLPDLLSMPRLQELDLSGNEVLDVQAAILPVQCSTASSCGSSGMQCVNCATSSSAKTSRSSCSATTSTTTIPFSSSNNNNNNNNSSSSCCSSSSPKQCLVLLDLSSTGITPEGLANLLTLPQLQQLQLLRLHSCKKLPSPAILQRLRALPNNTCCFSLDITIGTPAHQGEGGASDLESFTRWLEHSKQQLQELRLYFKVRRADLLPIFAHLTEAKQLQVLSIKQPSASPLCSSCYAHLAALTQLTLLEISGRVGANAAMPTLGALTGLRALTLRSMPMQLARVGMEQDQHLVQQDQQLQHEGDEHGQEQAQQQQQQQSPWLSLLQEVAAMPSLTHLDLAYFDLGSQDPASLAAAAALAALTGLRSLRFTGACHSLAALQKLANLEVLEVPTFLGAKFVVLQGLTNLQQLIMSLEALPSRKAAELLGALAPLRRLTHLEVLASDLSAVEALRGGLSLLSNLQGLHLSYWVLDDTGGKRLQCLAQSVPHLSSLHLRVYWPTKEGYEAAASALLPLKRLRELELNSNFMKLPWGHVPCPLGLSVLTQLTKLSLGFGPEGLLEFDVKVRCMVS